MKYEIEIKQACEGFWSCISPDAWIQSIGGLIGTFLGAFIAAWISIRILKSQFIRENKKELENEYNMLMKFNEKYLRIVHPIMNNLRIIENCLEEKNEENMANFKELVKINREMASEFNNLDTTNLSYVAEDKVNMLNRDIQMIMLQVSLGALGNESVMENFLENLEKLRTRFKDYDNYPEVLKASIPKVK
jgi:hypothetical protein